MFIGQFLKKYWSNAIKIAKIQIKSIFIGKNTVRNLINYVRITDLTSNLDTYAK